MFTIKNKETRQKEHLHEYTNKLKIHNFIVVYLKILTEVNVRT